MAPVKLKAVDGVVLVPAIRIPGYHRLRYADRELGLAVTPKRCVTVDDIAPDRKLWGLMAQIYSLRRDGDGGIGDSGALAALAETAAKAGADITTTILDRNTRQIVTNGNNEAMPIASVVKLFIADDLLLQEAKGQTQLSPADRTALDAMLRSSDDSAAEVLRMPGPGTTANTPGRPVERA